jgi:hypothetical protein
MQGECGRGYKLDKDGNNSNEGVNGEKKMEGDIRSGRSEESVFFLSCVSDVLEASIRVLMSASEGHSLQSSKTEDSSNRII